MIRFWQRLSGPTKVGLAFGLLGALLTLIGLFTGNLAPLSFRTVVLGILIGGGSWGLVSWAIAMAASDALVDEALADKAATAEEAEAMAKSTAQPEE
jgi:hypothetical protein